MIDSVRELRFLQRLALAAASTLDAGELMRLVIAETTEAAVTDVCSIYLREPDAGTLVLTATNGLSQAGVGRVRLQMGEGITGWAAAERRPVVIPDVREEPRFRWLHGVDQARFVSMCSVPIVSHDRLIGVLNVQTDARRDFAEADVNLLSAIAAQVAGALERSELQSRLESRLEELRHSDEIHRHFSELALSRAGLDPICAAISRHALAPAAVYDDEGERLGASDEAALPARLEGFVDPVRRDDGLSVIPVRAGRELLGWLGVAGSEGEDDIGRRLAIEHGVTVLALELVRQRTAVETEERIRGDLVEELVATPLDVADANRLAARAARLGVRIRGPVWVIVIDPDDAVSAGQIAPAATRRRVLRALTDLVGDLGGLAVGLGDGLVILVPAPLEPEQIEAIAAQARERAAAAARASVTAGISSRPGGPAELHQLAGEARLAVRVSHRARRAGVVAPYRRLGVDRLLFEVAEPERLEGFVDEFLGDLIRHDRRGPAAAPLMRTLEALVAESWNLRAAARALTVHINTLLYRIGKIEELTGRRLDSAEERLSLAMALRARVMLGDSDDGSDGDTGQSRMTAPYGSATGRRTLVAVSPNALDGR